MPALNSSLASQLREYNENETSDQESSNQNNQSTSQSNQSSSPTGQPEDQAHQSKGQTHQSTSQTRQSSNPPAGNTSSDLARSSDIKLALPWNTRDQIINHLNKLSKLLCLGAPEDVKELVVEPTSNLTAALIGLSSSDAQPEDEERPAKRARIDGESNARRPFFLIPLEMSREILSQLVRNVDAIRHLNLDASSKNRLRKQNDHLNIQLQSLPVISGTSSDESDPFDQPTSLDIDLDQSSQMLERTVAASQSKFESLQKNFQRLEKIVQRFGETNSEVILEYELVGVRSFFSSNASRRYSRTYMCGGCPWSILLHVIDGVENHQVVPFLGFFLMCERTSDANEPWSIRTRYDLILLSSSNNSQLRQMRYGYTFKHTDACESRSYGEKNYISFDELKRNNYIQNDRIKVRIELKCDQLVVG